MIIRTFIPQAHENGCLVHLSSPSGKQIRALAIGNAPYTLVSERYVRDQNIPIEGGPRILPTPWSEASKVSGRARVSLSTGPSAVHIWCNVTNSMPPGIDILFGNSLRSFQQVGVYGEVLENGSIGNLRMHFVVFKKEVSWPCVLIPMLMPADPLIEEPTRVPVHQVGMLSVE